MQDDFACNFFPWMKDVAYSSTKFFDVVHEGVKNSQSDQTQVIGEWTIYVNQANLFGQQL